MLLFTIGEDDTDGTLAYGPVYFDECPVRTNDPVVLKQPDGTELPGRIEGVYRNVKTRYGFIRVELPHSVPLGTEVWSID